MPEIKSLSKALGFKSYPMPCFDKITLKDSYNNVNSDDGTLVNKTETDIFSRLIHPTAGGSLPFIFQPDSTNFAADQFAICTLDQNSIGFQQTSPSLYNIRLKVGEIW